LEEQTRETFNAAELAVVLSHYELGVIEAITGYPRGSRRSPKAGIVAQRGKFLLKRRAAGKSDPDRVRLAHRVQQTLTEAGFPAPKLIPTRSTGNTLLQLKGQAYEMFDFVVGESYARTPSQTRAAGDMLARFHEATAGFSPTEFAPIGDYHDANAIRTGLCAIGSGLSSHDSFTGDEAELASLIQTLIATYDQAAEAVDATGFAGWEPRILHADWHPGNLMFRRNEVVAVIDYDSVRRSQRIIDVANGVLQFSMRGEGDPVDWPPELDQKRLAAFLSGYHQREPLAEEELACQPHLMVEALITECVPPITRTGGVGRWAGFRVLQMVRRKTAWLLEHSDELIGRAHQACGVLS